MGLYRDSYLHDALARTFVSCSCNQIFTQIPSAKHYAFFYVTYVYCEQTLENVEVLEFSPYFFIQMMTILFLDQENSVKILKVLQVNSVKYFGIIWILEQYFIFPTHRRYWVDPKSYQSNNFLVWEKFLTLSHLAGLLAPGKRIKICQDHSTLPWFQNLSVPFTQVIFAKPQTEEKKGQEGPRVWTTTDMGLRE